MHTPDVKVARKRLRDIVVEKQREAAGLTVAALLRETRAAAITTLFAEYEAHLKANGRSADYVRDTMKRLDRMAREMAWARVGDIRGERFVTWRRSLKRSAKRKRNIRFR